MVGVDVPDTRGHGDLLALDAHPGLGGNDLCAPDANQGNGNKLLFTVDVVVLLRAEHVDSFCLFLPVYTLLMPEIRVNEVAVKPEIGVNEVTVKPEV